MPEPFTRAASARCYWKIIGILSALSLAILLLLRLYALNSTLSVRTPWDDTMYRTRALTAAGQITPWQAIKAVALPNAQNLEQQRSIGYHSWLVMFLKVWPVKDSERNHHWANFVLLLIQLGLLYWLCVSATGRHGFSLLVTFLYLSCPMIFGINRFVLSENHICTAVMVFSALAFELLRPPDKATPGILPFGWREVLKPLGIAWAIGCFSTLREYALPNFVILTGCILLGLAIRRRWIAFAVFCAALMPYVWAMKTALGPVIQIALKKSNSGSTYFHPAGELLAFLATSAMGLALFILVFFGLALTAVAMLHHLWTTARAQGMRHLVRSDEAPLMVLWLGHWAVMLAGLTLIFISSNRLERYFLPPIVGALGAIAVGIRLTGYLQKPIHGRGFTCLILLLVLSWSTMSYQLFHAFDGGKTYGVHPYHLTHWNHPLHLRPLQGPDDWHIIKLPGGS